MLRLVLRVWLYLMGLSLGAIVLVCALPYDDSPIEHFMIAPENCGGTCLLGIIPSKTTVGEVMILLRNHAWVNIVRQNAAGNGYGQVTWDWSGEQPSVIDDTRQGRITFYWDDDDSIELINTRIETITVYTHIRMYSWQQWMSEADASAATLRPDNKLRYAVAYNIPNGMIDLSTEIVCPLDMLSYWNARTRLTMSIGRQRSPFINITDNINIC